MRLFQFVVEIFKAMKCPDASHNYFPENVKNVEMYKNYKKDRMTYYEIAKAMTYS
jgi:hypothetical protein